MVVATSFVEKSFTFLQKSLNFFFRHCRVAHGVATDGNRIFVTGGSAKANSNFGPGLYEMEMCEVVEGKKPEWQMVGEMGEGRSFLGSVVLDKMVYQIGGCLSEDKSTTEVSFFNYSLKLPR